MKCTGRIMGLLVAGTSSTLWFMYGNANGSFFLASIAAIIQFGFSWWIGQQYDAANYNVKQQQTSKDENNKLLESKRQHTNKLLAGSQQQFTSLFMHNTEAILAFDLNGNLVDANPAVEKICGYSFEELKQISPISIVVPEHMERKWVHCKKAMEGEPQEYELSIIHKNKQRLDMHITMIPIKLGNDIIGVFEIIKDVTEAKKLEEFMRQSEKLSLVGQLAAGIAHEIRNPLTTIRGFLQLFESKIDRQHVNVMLSEIDRINLIVGEFLMLAKPQKNIFKEKDLESILVNVITFLEGQANIQNIQVTMNTASSIPLIQCEENQLKQVFINLLKNAMEAMPDGGEIYVEVNQLNQDEVCVLIRDEGCGIPQEQLHRIGNPFYSTKEEGTGLGMMVSHKIIENHGGYITLDSEVGKGTTVRVIIPA